MKEIIPTRTELSNEALEVLPEEFVQEMVTVRKLLDACDYKQATTILMDLVIIQMAHMGHMAGQGECAHDTAHEAMDEVDKLRNNISNLAGLIGKQLEEEFDEKVNQSRTH